MSEAWVTLATNDTYGVGALVLAASLRNVGTTRMLHILITKDVSSAMRSQLGQAFDALTLVDALDSGDAENLALIGRPDLGCTFSKLHCWRLTQYTKAVFLDADTLILQNADELFGLPELSAAPDFGWPDCFNSGVFVFQPNTETYRALVGAATGSGSFDGGDQGILNEFFSTWRSGDPSRRLSILYNMSSSAVYTYAAAYQKYKDGVKIVHFLGALKPWNYSLGHGGVPSHPQGTHQPSHVGAWWALYLNIVRPRLSISAPQLASIVAAPGASEREVAEAGILDIGGKDSFDKILSLINQNIDHSSK